MDLAITPFLTLGVALVAGLLIGLEREQSGSASFPGGARTYPLIALVGGLTSILLPTVGPWLVLLPLAGIFGLMLLIAGRAMRAGEQVGLTSDAALLVTYLIGVLATSHGVVEPASQRSVLVAAVAVVTTLLLSLKPTLHGLVHKVSKDDVYALVKFLLVAVVVLPLLPNEPIGPWGAINPFQIGLLVALITGLSLLGYVAVRILGPGRGLGVTGLLGGLVSSTAVTVSMSNQARDRPELDDAFAVAVVLASTVMAVRIGVLVQVVEPGLLPVLIVPLLLMTVAGVAASGWFYLRTRQMQARADAMTVENPAELGPAARFAVIFVVMLLATKAATLYLGDSGTYLAALVGGALDVDTISLSMAKLARQGLDLKVAGTAILIGAASNTVVKGTLAAWLGGKTFGARVGVAFLAMLVCAALGLVFLWR